MSRAKAIWRGAVGDFTILYDGPEAFVFAGKLDREPDRSIRLRITDPRFARWLARALLRWADSVDPKTEQPNSNAPALVSRQDLGQS